MFGINQNLDKLEQESVNTINELCPQGDGQGGGVGLLYKNYYKTGKQNVAQYSSFKYMETLIKSPSTFLRIGVVYRPLLLQRMD